MLKAFVMVVAALVGVVAGLWVFGPYEPVDTEIAFDPSFIPEEVEGWLADRDAQVPDLREGEEKRILWAGAAGERTDLALVYVHGFSAGPWETRPVPDRVAEALGANLHFTRLTGHGRDGDAMAEASAGDWIEDLAEATAVGRRIGERVVVIGTSQGGTLTALLAADPALESLREGLAGIALISPNFRVANPAARLLSLPAARLWLPWVAGAERAFEPLNDRHERHWTTRYPTTALLPMQAVIDRAETLDWAATDLPALFLFDPLDEVVDTAVTERVAAEWGGAATVIRVERQGDDDPFRHVIAGDILSPAATPAAIATLIDWIEAEVLRR